MPDEPENPSNLPNRHRPQLSDLSKETTEDDLWDLDESAPQARKPSLPKSSAEPESSPAEGFEIKPEPRERPGRPATKEQAKEKPAAKKIANQIDSSSAARIGPRSVDPKTRPEPPKAARQSGPKRRDPKPGTTAAVEVPAAAELEELREELVEPVPPPKDKPSEPKEHASESDKKDPIAAPTAKSEKIGLIALGVVFLAIATWWLTSLFSSIPTTRLGDDEPDFPVEGNFVTISNGESYWREPVREGPNPDVARADVRFIPALTIELKDSQSGVLRALFRDEQGDYIGDSISRSFAGGVFDENASSSIEFPATDGFDNLGDFNGYRVGEDLWTVDVLEGPSSDAPGSEFKLIFSAPISTNRR